MTTTADNPLFLRVYFSLVDELPCVLRTGIVQLDKELVPPTYQSVGEVLKTALGGKETLIDIPIIQEDMRDSIVNHLLLQFCLSCQKVLETNTQLTPEMREQISWSSLCSQFLINRTHRVSLIFESDSDEFRKCLIPEVLLKALSVRGTMKPQNTKRFASVDEINNDVIVTMDKKNGHWRIKSDSSVDTGKVVDYSSDYFAFERPENQSMPVPDTKTRKIVQQKDPVFALNFRTLKRKGNLYPFVRFQIENVTLWDSSRQTSVVQDFVRAAQERHKIYNEQGEKYYNIEISKRSDCDRCLLGSSIENYFYGLINLRGLQEQRRQEYFEFIKVMAKSAYRNALSVQDYILSASPEAAEATTTEVSAADRLQVQQIGQVIKDELEQKPDDERIDVTSFIVPAGDNIVQFLTEQNKFVKSEVVSEYPFSKKGDDNKYHKVIRRVLRITLEKPLSFYWVRRNMTMDGKRSYSYAPYQTAQVQSIVDTRADDLTHPAITTIYPEPPRGARLSFTPLK